MNAILILRGGAIGDFVLTLPVCDAIRKHRPNTRIELAGYPRTASLALAAGLADTADSLEKPDFARLFSRNAAALPEWTARLASFDVVLSYLHDPEGIVRANLMRAGARRVVYRSPLVASGHAADHLAAPLAELDIPVDLPAMPRLTLPPALLAEGASMVRDFSGGVIGIHPGSGSKAKNWPLEKFVALARNIRTCNGLTPVFLAGEADAAAETAIRELSEDMSVVSGCELVRIAALLANCDGYVGNDSGITHLAAALGIPAVALFGPTDPEVWGPRGQRVRIIRSPEPTTVSLSTIEPETVREAIRATQGAPPSGTGGTGQDAESTAAVSGCSLPTRAIASRHSDAPGE